MANSHLRTWKIQEFAAHESNVNCLALGQQSGRVLVTGGYDRKVNLWALGNSTYILSLNAHQSPVECVKFGHTEEFVCSGSQAGELNIWNLEANRKTRTFSGHRDAIKCLDFHPYGDFLASGSLDTSIKLWDVRRKGVLSSYRGHTLTVNRVRFSPDGIWMASAGEDGHVMLWDVRVGRRLADMTDHEAAVLTVQFHPHEFLMASGGMDRIVQFWDLEKFKSVSHVQQEAGPVRCLRFSPEGNCLFAGVDEQLKVFAWEPGRLLDSVSTGWGSIQDLVQTGNQLVGASFLNNKVTLITVDLNNVKMKAEPPPAANSAFPPRSANVRKSFSKEKLLPGSFTVKKSPTESDRNWECEESGKAFQPLRTLNRTPPPVPVISESPEPVVEDPRAQDHYANIHYDTPTSETEPLSLSSLDSNPPRGASHSHDYHTVTQPPPSYQESPRSLSPRNKRSPMADRRHSTSENRRPALPDKPKFIPPSRQPPHRLVSRAADAETDYPIKMNNIRHSPSEPSLSSRAVAPPRLRKASDATPVSARQPVSPTHHIPDVTPLTARPAGNRPVLPVRPSPAASPAYYTPPQSFSKVEQTPEDISQSLCGVNIEDFLPKSANKSTSFQSGFEGNVSESGAFNSLMSIHSQVMMALSSRKQSLNVVLATWQNKDAKCAVEVAADMRDPALMADVLGVMVLRPNIWTLDMCAIVLPSIEDLLQSKYDAYMTVGCSVLTVILRSFAHVIRSNILAPVGTHGVDIPREERYNKSMRCYQTLISIRAFLLKRQTLPGKLGQSFRDALTLMANLDN